ncbi:MAG: prepilin peptidase [Lachnospiraceae bacterium]|nr:prepilin peptidase [Lachnospiraceae bacterium]
MDLIPTSLKILLYIIVFLYGIIIGSFVNVCICRIPKKESVVKVRSHCESCGYQLKWYDLVPLFSYLCLGGKCRKCRAKISVQHPIIEVLNGFLYILVLSVCGLSIESLLYCLAGSALLALSVIDFRTYEIPVGFNIFIGALGMVRVITDYTNWSLYLIGFVAVSAFLYVLYIISKGRAIGGGDIKLMAVCGLLLGWKLIILAFFIGCIMGSVIHVIRMKVSGEEHVLAMGPYLSMGVMTAALWGNTFLNWYLDSMGL